MRFSKMKLLTLPVACMALCLASCNETYTINFALEDGTILQSKTYSKNETPIYEGATPTKDEDLQGKYTFKGWDKEIGPANRETTYIAVFDVQNKYEIRFLDWEQKDIVDPQYVLEGEMPVIPTNTAREDVGETHYDFTGWNKEVTVASEKTSYYAQYSSVHTCLITFLSPDGEVLQSSRFPEGTTPYFDGTPFIPDDKETKTAYEFIRWDKELAPVTGDATYTGIFRAVESKEDWTAVEKGYLSYCLYTLPFYKARFELSTDVTNGLFILTSGRECDEDDFDDYCDLVSDISNDEIKAILAQQGASPELINNVEDYAFMEEDNMGTLQDTWLLEDEFGSDFEWRYFRSGFNGFLNAQIIAVGFNETSGTLLVVETLYYSVTNGQLRYGDDGYATYPYSYQKNNDIFDEIVYFTAFGLDNAFGSNDEDYDNIIKTTVTSAMPALENEFTLSAGYFEFSEYGYTNPFTLGNIYNQIYCMPQYEIDFNLIEEDEYNAYFDHLTTLGFVYDEEMSTTEGDYAAKAYKKVITVADSEGPYDVELYVYVGEYNTIEYINGETGEKFNSGNFWISMLILEAAAGE